jgi:hypothetical protein
VKASLKTPYADFEAIVPTGFSDNLEVNYGQIADI